jgi:hypothetical protein
LVDGFVAKGVNMVAVGDYFFRVSHVNSHRSRGFFGYPWFFDSIAEHFDELQVACFDGNVLINSLFDFFALRVYYDGVGDIKRAVGEDKNFTGIEEDSFS